MLNADVDECTLDSHNCHKDAFCTNTNGSFSCACRPGYTGDGVSCGGGLFFFFERALLIHWCQNKEMWGDGCRFTRRDGIYEPQGRLICNLGLYCCP